MKTLSLLSYTLVYSFAFARTELPAKFDLRDYQGEHLVTSVKDQKGGTCWTHSTMAALESNLLVTKNWESSGETGEPNLAEYHLDWWNGFNQHRNHDVHPEKNGLTVHQGGDYRVAAAYLSRGGAVRDIDGQSYQSPPKEIGFKQFYVRDIVWFSAGKSLENIDSIKQALMTHGAMGTALTSNNSLMSGNNHYQPPSHAEEPNHAVTIVGWDDSRKTQAPKPGAWLIKNSWGTEWGNGGYFWISYYDKVAGQHPEMGAVSFQNVVPFEYLNIYAHDWHGWRDTFAETTGFNAFLANAEEDLKSISFYTTAPKTSFTLSVFGAFNGEELSLPLMYPLSGEIDEVGFHTVDLLNPVALKKGMPFYVKLDVSEGGMAYDRTSDVPVLLGASYRVQVKSAAKTNQSFLRVGNEWRDTTKINQTANLAIKALTVAR